MQLLLETQDSLLIYAVFVCAAISLLTNIVWSVFNFEKKRMLLFSVIFSIAAVISFFPIYYFWIYENFYLIGIRLQLICPLILLITTIFIVCDFNGKQFAAGFSYIFNLIFLLLGLEALKSAGGTWGNSNLAFGTYVVFNGLITLQVLTYLYQSNLLYGLLKLFCGIVSAVVTIIWGLNRGDDYWVGEPEIIARYCIGFVTVTLIIEGLFLIYKARKDRYLKNYKMM